MRRMPARQHAAGFTVVELLTVIFIVLIMLVLISQIFDSTTSAISASVTLNASMSQARTMGKQLTTDINRMILPGSDTTEGGFMVIVNKRYDGVPMIAAGGNGVVTQNIRSDQLLFFIRSGNGRPLYPGSADALLKNRTRSSQGAPNLARVWYGHAQRTSPSGKPTSMPTAVIGGDFWDFGDYDGTAGPSGSVPIPQGATDYFGNRWVLARHQLGILDDAADASLRAENPTSSSTIVSAIDDVSPAIGNQLAGNAGFNPLTLGMFWGAVDVTPVKLRGPLDAMVRFGAPPNPEPFYQLGNDQVASEYGPRALLYPFVSQGRRLFVQTAPGPSGPMVSVNVHGVDSYSGSSVYASYQFKLMQNYLVGNCSDFIVEFAGDYDGTPGIDLVGSGSDQEVRWYSHFEDTDANAYQPPISSAGFVSGADNADVSRAIYHQSMPSPPSGASGTPSFTHGDAAFVFRHHAAKSTWPIMLRIRYRLHDSNGRLMHTDPATGNMVPGQWYEHIFNLRPIND